MKCCIDVFRLSSRDVLNIYFCFFRLGLCGGEVCVRRGGKLHLPGVRPASVAAGRAQVDDAALGEPTAAANGQPGA